jgi:ABC-2 type transport system permease protein
MTRFSPGSTLWLLSHEIRLAWRAMASRRRVRGRGGLLLIVGLLVFVGFVAGVPAALGLRYLHGPPPPILLLALDGAVVLVWTLMLSQTLSASATALYERRDLDLLLSSPLSARRVMAVRGLGIAVMAVVWFAAIATPFVLPAAVIASPRWLAVYLMLIALALLAAAAGLLLAMALFAVLGPRRTRTVAQVMAAVIGAVFFLAAQSRNFLPDRGYGAGRSLVGWAEGVTRSGQFGANSPLAWPALAVLGEPLPLLVFVGLSALAFSTVAASLGRRFAANAAAAAGAGAGGRGRAGRVRLRDFKGGAFGAVLRKELRLLWRDPALLSQVLLRVLYLLPLMFVVVRNATQHAGVLVAGGSGGVVVMAGQVAGSLSWITISAEDSPELIACAPVARRLVGRAKMAAALLPVAALVILPCLVVGWFSPLAGIGTFVGAMSSAVCATLLNLWYQKPGKRQDFRRRRSASLLAGIAELAVSLIIGFATGFFSAGSWFWLIPAVVAAGLMLALRRREPPQAYLPSAA